jgi:hypothetical protein
MATQEIAAAMQRVEAILQRRPDVGVQPEAPATARWEGGTRIVASHANGAQMPTEMPTELGGAGNDVHVTPGWLFPRGFASCAATCIAMGAAAQGIELASLEVHRDEPLGLRGLLNMKDADGTPVYAGPATSSSSCASAAPGVAARALACDGRGALSLLAHLERGGERDAGRPFHRHRRRLGLSRETMDALSETLRVVRLVGAIFIEAKFTAPWCYNSPAADSAAPVLEPGAERVGHLPPHHRGRVLRRDGRQRAPCISPPVDAVVFPKGTRT